MNADGRNALKELYYKIDEHRDLLEQIQSEIAGMMCDEEAKLDNLPDALRESETGERIQECVDTLEASISDLEEVNTCIYNCLEHLEEILGSVF